MSIKKMKINDGESFFNVTIGFHSGLNLIIGDTGAGKTKVIQWLRVANSLDPGKNTVVWADDDHTVAAFELDPRYATLGRFGEPRMDCHGGNLYPTLMQLLSDTSSKRSLCTLLRFLLPNTTHPEIDFIVEDDTIKMTDVYIKGKYHDISRLPSGIVSAIQVILALYNTPRGTIAIDEPDRFMSHQMINNLYNLLVDAAEERQVIITTKNRDLIARVDDHLITFLYRDDHGRVRACRPSKSRRYRTFLRNGLSLAELFADGTLQAVV